jgi:hypothetical protein
MRRIFLLSPASCTGRRAAIVMREEATFPLAERLRSPAGAPVGETMSFLSGLYFRGKLAYSTKFARPPKGVAGAFVITPCRGLWPVNRPLDLATLHAFAEVDIHADEPRYAAPLLEDLHAFAKRAGEDTQWVLLGSIATGKYVDVLARVLGEDVWFPETFVGRGDMSRGGLMLRAADEGLELDYIRVAGARRHGARPPKLAPLQR